MGDTKPLFSICNAHDTNFDWPDHEFFNTVVNKVLAVRMIFVDSRRSTISALHRINHDSSKSESFVPHQVDHIYRVRERSVCRAIHELFTYCCSEPLTFISAETSCWTTKAGTNQVSGNRREDACLCRGFITRNTKVRGTDQRSYGNACELAKAMEKSKSLMVSFVCDFK